MYSPNVKSNQSAYRHNHEGLISMFPPHTLAVSIAGLFTGLSLVRPVIANFSDGVLAAGADELAALNCFFLSSMTSGYGSGSVSFF